MTPYMGHSICTSLTHSIGMVFFQIRNLETSNSETIWHSKPFYPSIRITNSKFLTEFFNLLLNIKDCSLDLEFGVLSGKVG